MSRSPFLLDESTRELIGRAVETLLLRLRERAASLAGPTETWVRGLAQGSAPEVYFFHPQGFPMFHLPGWVASPLVLDSEIAFQITYSTVSGYYYVRLIDNVFDHPSEEEIGLLPAAGFFHAEFCRGYHSLFPSQHPFWEVFDRQWLRGNESLVLERNRPPATEMEFTRLCAAKYAAGLIPAAAACCLIEKPALISAWRDFCDGIARIVQMTDDLFDCMRDLESDNWTYLLSVGRREKRDSESVCAWVFREGFDWAVDCIEQWTDELDHSSAKLNCGGISPYLNGRRKWLSRRRSELKPALRGLARLGQAWPNKAPEKTAP